MTSIEWLIKELYTEMNMSGDGRVLDEILEQAKEMHKQEIIQAVDFNFNYDDNNNACPTLGEQYYQETFVSNDVREEALQFLATQAQELNLGYEAQLPQQEISDEEIEKASFDFWRFNEHTQSTCWKLGAKWYREQLKQKQ